MAICMLWYHHFQEMCAYAISLHINVINIPLLSHYSYHSLSCETVAQFYEITYNGSMCTHIQVFDSVSSESLLLWLHLNTLYDMVKLGFHHLFLLVLCHMMYIYIALLVKNLIHVISIVIQQSMWSQSTLLYILHTCFCISLLQHKHVIFCCSS